MHLFSGIIKGICGFCQMQNNQHIRMLPSALFVRGWPVLLSNKKETELSMMLDWLINSNILSFNFDILLKLCKKGTKLYIIMN